jgi:hypothetical protein
MRRSALILRGASALAAALVAGPTALAQTNSGFEAGLSGWTTLGDVSTLPRLALLPDGGVSAAVATTASFADVDDSPLGAGALNASGSAPLAAGGALETGLGLAPGALDLDGTAYEGSALSQRLFVSSGDTLSFRWRFASNDGLSGDFAFLSVGDRVVRLGGVELLPGTPVADWSRGASAWQDGSYLFTTTGELQIGFGVVDIGDFTASSAVAIDSLAITPVPGPAAAFVLAAGLALSGAISRRRRRDRAVARPLGG